MQPLVKKIEASVISISVQSGLGIIETTSERDDSKTIVFQVTAETPLMTKDGQRLGVSAIPVKGKITVYVDSLTPLTMIQPPHVVPLLVIFEQYGKKGEVSVGVFDDRLFSDQLKLKLHVGSKTEIVDLTGKRVNSDMLVGRLLFVFYDKATRSKPVQANPMKIIVTNLKEN
ncbi:hypothetical protein CSE16_00975 [Solibacillus sp. R5-41]|uniref:hypothetical protein n=1 Tax=Solibacillus sp. R5-41 TaxID=2048654 RepID=UPI000C127BA7|nr:hypothetical protein [Solibacillus sp. R5-41]ATP38716.1 hypothetical protein CSE16_00975 [Solibacillus sp. R5-41]